MGIFALSYAAFEIPSGAMGDRIGARKVLTRIVLWWSAFTSAHRRGFGLFRSAVRAIRVRRGRSGRLSQRSSAHLALVPDGRTRARAWHRVDGEPHRRSVVPAAGDTDSRWRMAGESLLPVRCRRAGVVRVWYWWYRDHAGRKAGVTRRNSKRSAGERAVATHGLPWGDRVAERESLEDHADVSHVLLGQLFLSLVAAHIPAEGAGLQRRAR